MKVADLFSGVGGLSLGFRQAGFAVAFAIEHDKEIAEAYSRNDSSAVMFNEDITRSWRIALVGWMSLLAVRHVRVFRKRGRDLALTMTGISCSSSMCDLSPNSSQSTLSLKMFPIS